MLEGVILGQYQVLEKNATQDIAEYYLGKVAKSDPPFEHVFIKRIVPALADISSFNDMLLNEHALAKYLIHDNIVKIVGFECYNNANYLMLEYIPGQNLDRVIRQGIRKKQPIPIEISIQIIAQVANGLDFAYNVKDAKNRALRIVHRNVTPESIWCADNGKVKIRDFGCAVSSLLSSKENESQNPHTNMSYMSPEFVAGSSLDCRSDIFSLGVILWELITNRRLFESDDQAELMQKISECQIPVAKDYNTNIPDELNRIVMTMLAKEPDQRFSSHQAVGSAIQAFAKQFNTITTSAALASYIQSLFHDNHEVSDGNATGGKNPAEPTRLPAIDASGEEDDADDINLDAVVTFISKSKKAIGQDYEAGLGFVSEEKTPPAGMEMDPQQYKINRADYQEFVAPREYDAGGGMPEPASRDRQEREKDSSRADDASPTRPSRIGNQTESAHAAGSSQEQGFPGHVLRQREGERQPAKNSKSTAKDRGKIPLSSQKLIALSLSMVMLVGCLMYLISLFFSNRVAQQKIEAAAQLRRLRAQEYGESEARPQPIEITQNRNPATGNTTEQPPAGNDTPVQVVTENLDDLKPVATGSDSGQPSKISEKNPGNRQGAGNDDPNADQGFKIGGGQGEAKVVLSDPILIRSDPPGAFVFFNGDISKKKTPENFRLRVNWTYNIEVVKEGYFSASKEIYIESKNSIKEPIDIRLEKIPSK